MKTAHRALLALLPLAALASCQTYDFEPVTPLAIAQTTQSKIVTAKQLKPDLMLLIDKSGSMNDGVNGGAASATNPSKISALKSVMGTFLTSQGKVARFGASIFPKGQVCDPTSSSEVLNSIMVASDSDTDLQNQATAVNNNVQMLTPGGGTPTALSLAFLGTLSDLNDPQREDFILLLTDGLPNCNPGNPNTCTMPATCQCTLNGGNCGTVINDNDANNFCRRGCLDEDGSVQAIRNLRDVGMHAGGIRTIVIGFGSDTAGGAAGDVLNAMAIAGGFQRTCPNSTDAECGSNNTCILSSKVCQKAYYQAANGTELATALAQISDNLNGDSICKYTLESQPSSQDLVSVIIDGTPQQSGPDTWKLDAGQIIMQGALCTKLKGSTTTNPVKVEIRIVETL